MRQPDPPSPFAAYGGEKVKSDRSARRAYLLGHSTVTFNSGWTINSIPIFRKKDGSLSAGPPSIPVLDRDGRHRIGGDGKKVYAALIVFEGAGRDLWNRTIIQALADAGINPAGEGAP